MNKTPTLPTTLRCLCPPWRERLTRKEQRALFSRQTNPPIPKRIKFADTTDLKKVEVAIDSMELMIFDMAGTTICDKDLVTAAFDEALAAGGMVKNSVEYHKAISCIKESMGASHSDVFQAIFPDQAMARECERCFDQSYAMAIATNGISEVQGTTELFDQLRTRSVPVALTTGFCDENQRLLISKLNWQNHVCFAVSPSEHIAGYPHPDMIIAAMHNAGIKDSSVVVTVGDTRSDMVAAKAAGVALAIGVLYGEHCQEELIANGADIVVTTVLDLTSLIYAMDIHVE